jgi:ubiquitin-conjugating enzyme E2 M
MKGRTREAILIFQFKFTSQYPFAPPKVSVLEKVYHPNLSVTGGVCLNILREEYKPTLTLTMFILGCIFFFEKKNRELILLLL